MQSYEEMEPASSGSRSKMKFNKPKVEGGSFAPATINWASMKESDLLAYYTQIREHLPPTALSELDVEHELILQFHTVKQLQNEILTDEATPANQKSQVANSVATLISKLMDMQLEVYSSERFKKIENLLIRELKKLPEDWSEKFLIEYERILRADT